MVECRLLLVQPSRLSREGLRGILHGVKGTIQDVSSAYDFLKPESILSPDVVIWGAGIPVKTLCAEIGAIRARFCRMPIPARHLVLSSDLTPSYMRQVAKLDPEAVLHDDITAEVLLRSIELVIFGQRIVPALRRREPSVTHSEVVPFPPTQMQRRVESTVPFTRKREADLSSRESEILHYLVDGVSNKAIAHNLQITEATVKVHVRAVFRKIGASNRTQAAIWALNNPYEIGRNANYS